MIRMPGAARARRRLAALAMALPLALGAALLPAAPAAADAARDAEWWLEEYGIRAAWRVTEGAGVTIAVIDTGVDGTVADLQGAVLSGTDFSGWGSNDGWTPVGESSEHGTLVASIAAGRGHGANLGVIGVAPKASILPISIGFGQGMVDSDTQIAQAVRYAVDHGAHIINMSLTRNTPDWPTSWDEAFQYAMDHDVLIVAAAGNRGSGTEVVSAPATMPGVLSVAGVDRSGKASLDASTQGITIGIAAPSEQLVGVAPGGAYMLWEGTSGAAPIVSGVAALVMSAHPELDAANVINRIIATATDAGAKGPDPMYGYGLIDAYAAVTASVPLVDANPMGDLAEWIRVYRPADVPETPLPTPVVVIPAPEPLPVAEVPDPTGVLLPSVDDLRVVGIPLLVIAVLLVGASGIAVWVALGVRGLRRTR